MNFSGVRKVRARSVPAFLKLILGFLLTIFVSFFVLFDKNLLFFCARTTRTVPALFISYFVSFI